MNGDKIITLKYIPGAGGNIHQRKWCCDELHNWQKDKTCDSLHRAVTKVIRLSVIRSGA